MLSLHLVGDFILIVLIPGPPILHSIQGRERNGVRSGRASDSESRGPGFDPHKRHRVVSLSKTH